MVVGALIVKHVENLSDEKTIQVIQENPYMQYLLGLPCFTETLFLFRNCSYWFASVLTSSSSIC